MKGIFTRNINYNTYDEIVSCAKNKIIGNIPQDILHSAIRLKNKKEVILNIQNGFAQATDEISSIEKLLVENQNSLKISRIEQTAAAKIQTAMKDVLPNDAKVKITYLNEGCFGKAYKLEFIGNNGQKIYKDRVLKIFKNQDITNPSVKKCTELQQRLTRPHIYQKQSDIRFSRRT